MRNRVITTDLPKHRLSKVFRDNDIFVLGENGNHVCVTSEHVSFTDIQHLIWDVNPYVYCEIRDAKIEEVTEHQ